MTPEQENVLAFVREYIGDKGCSPTLEEIKLAVGDASKAGIHRKLSALKDQGYLTWAYGRWRSIRLLTIPEDRIAALEKRVAALEEELTALLNPNVIRMEGKVK